MAKMAFEIDKSYMRPAWPAEAIGPQNMVAGGAKVVPSGFPSSDSFTVTVTAAETASATATIAVSALKGQVAKGYTLNFGSGKYATLNAIALKGAINIDANLAANLIGTETYLYPGTSGIKFIPAGTFVSRTFAERDAGIGFHKAVATDHEFYLLAFDTPDASVNPDCELLRHGALVRDHLLPGWTDLAANIQALIRANYECVRGPVTV